MDRQDVLAATGPPTPGEGATEPHPYRLLIVIVESTVALGAVVGAWQLLTGTLTPPVSDLEPLGLSSWTLPGLWLAATVAVPSGLSAWLAWQRSPLTPSAVLWASMLLAVELVTQVPYVGISPLQLVFGAVAVGLAAVAIRARQLGWQRSPKRESARHG